MNGLALLTLVSPAVAIVVALWGFRRSTRADRLRAFFEIQDRYLADDVRAGRRHLHQSISGRSVSDVAKLEPSVRITVGHALAIMNSIAIACEGRYVDRTLVAR